MVVTGTLVAENLQCIDMRIAGKIYDVTDFLDGMLIDICSIFPFSNCDFVLEHPGNYFV